MSQPQTIATINRIHVIFVANYSVVAVHVTITGGDKDMDPRAKVESNWQSE